MKNKVIDISKIVNITKSEPVSDDTIKEQFDFFVENLIKIWKIPKRYIVNECSGKEKK